MRISETDERLAVIDCSSSAGTMLSPSEIFDHIINVFKEKKLI
jgi:hypothetical protein